MPATIISSQGAYKDAINGELSAVEFCAPWEAPCKEIGEKFDGYADKFGAQIKCYRVDICDQQDVAMDSGVKKCPQIHFYRKGAKIDEYVGTSYPALERKLAAVVNANKA